MRATTHAITHKPRASLVSRGGFLRALGSVLLLPWLDRADLSAVDEVFSDNVEAGSLGGGAESFRREVHTTFLVHTDDGARVPLRLISVADRTVSSHVEQFSLIFQAPIGTADLHGTRACEHQTLGRFDLFIVPIGASASRPCVYEACFSRFVSRS
jgi:uncharacterized protein DUF6916